MSDKREIMKGKMVARARYIEGLFIELNPPLHGKKYAVMNSNTRGYRKAHAWIGEDRLDIEVFYKIGPEALMITEI